MNCRFDLPRRTDLNHTAVNSLLLIRTQHRHAQKHIYLCYNSDGFQNWKKKLTVETTHCHNLLPAGRFRILSQHVNNPASVETVFLDDMIQTQLERWSLPASSRKSPDRSKIEHSR